MEGNGIPENKDDGLMLWDFTTSPAPDLSEWREQSDVVREPGKSKAVLVIQKSRLFQRAVFFTMLNPQPNGAGFAGYRTTARTLDLGGYSSLQMKVRGQGQNSHYKVTLHHMGMNDEPNPTYEQTFKVSTNLLFESFSVVCLHIILITLRYKKKKQST